MADSSIIIESITCPITGDIMTDPVQGNDGQTYERAAIVQALGIKSESPITRAPMTVADLKVNASIRYLCDKYHSGALGNIGDLSCRSPPKISTDSIKLDHTITRNYDNKTMLTFNIDESSMPKSAEGQEQHLSQDVVLVIDRSGSMTAAVEAKCSDGTNLEHGLSIQDIVNHAAKTIARTLDKNSRLGVVIFDNRIETLFDLMLMTERNSSNALVQIGTIKPGGQTNIWHAIEMAIKMLNDRDDKSRNAAVMMLTDGSPNVSPARGEVETLKRLRKTLNFTAPIYTFGFGYTLQRGLLYDLAKYGNGGNGYIPDGGMIATVFCNFIGTIMATVVLNLQLHITYSEDVNFALIGPVMGDFAYDLDSTDKSNRTVIVDLGTVQLGQMRNIIINTDDSTSPFSYYYTYKIGGKSYRIEEVVDVNITELELNESAVNIHIARYFAVEMMRKIINYKTVDSDSEAIICYNELEEYFISRMAQDPLSIGIIQNLTDQVKLTVNNNTYYKKWGEFYMDQLCRSMNQQIKPNFKDPGCPFGGDVFTDLVDWASDIFDTLTPPEPSIINHTRLSGPTPTPPPTRPSNLSAYNNPGGLCFAGECTVSMIDGTIKMIKDLKKGDSVCALSNPYNFGSPVVEAKVVCVLRTNIIDGMTNLVTFNGGLKITPWHPMIYNDEIHCVWAYPYNIKEPKSEDCPAVYTVVLDEFHTCMINTLWCITLGHGYKSGILQHPYYGTRAIINDLMRMDGWDAGLVIINNDCIVRDVISRDVIGLCPIKSDEISATRAYVMYG